MKRMESGTDPTLLGRYRVLDLAGDKGLLCGKILGDLGADVIKVEPPGGDPARSIGPFIGDAPHPDGSLSWLALNTSKRGITLNLESADGIAVFLRLLRSADILVESFVPGYLEASMETFSRNQEAMREQVHKAFEANPALANFEALARTNMEWFENAMRMFAPFATGMGAPGTAPKPPRKDVEIEELKTQLATMQAQLSRLVKDS
jgi:hypothetical protein